VNPQTSTRKPLYIPRPSPVADLIRRHRELMQDVWDRHASELQSPPRRQAAA
jgi:hypothetical protein